MPGSEVMSNGLGGIVKPAISAASKQARASKVKKVKLAVKVKIKKSEK